MARRVAALSLFPLLTLFHLLACTETSGETPSIPQEEPQGDPPYATLVLEATYPDGFSYLSGIRELSDGTVMVADPLAQLLLRLDMDEGSSDSLGRVGGGPGEFRQPDQVFPLPGDSTLLVDLGKAVLTVVGPHGGFYEGTSMVRPSPDGRMNILTPRFADEAGMIYHEVSRPRQGGAPDSVAAVQFDRATESSDTVALVWVPEPPARRMGSRSRVLATVLEPRDEWAAGRDGAVAVVRANGYRVDWFFPDGRRVTGPENPYEPIRVGEADKERALEELIAGAVSARSTATRSGTTSMSMSRGGPPGAGAGPSVNDFGWAELFPPVRTNGVRVSPEGRAWVERMLPHDAPPRVDVFDGEGIRLGYVELPLGSRLLGFGAGADGERKVYLVRTDEVGLKWLERHRVVSSPGSGP